MKKIIKIIKVIAILAFLIAALGYCGGMDTEYEQEREVMATQQPQRRNYE